MAIREEHYNSSEERQEKSKAIKQENKITGSKWRMLHDNFDDPNWKHGDPQVGTMTFTDELEPTLVGD